MNRGSRRGRRNVRPDARPFPRLATLHRWLGVGLGVWFALVGFSGALLVWRDEVDAWLNPQLFGLKSGTRSSGTSAGTAVAGSSNGPAATAAQPLDIERVLDLAHGELALGRVDRIHLPAAPGEPWRLQVRASRSRVESGRIEAFIDSQSGDLLGRRRLEGFSLAPEHAMRTLYEFHRNILLGEPGSDFVGLAGLLLLGSTVTGSVLAWPRTRERLLRLLSVSWRANATRVLFDLHRVGGVLIALVLLLTTLTGATLVYLNYVRDIVGLVSRIEPIPVLPFRQVADSEEPLTLEQLSARALQVAPGQRITEIRFSERGLTGVLFQLQAQGDVQRGGDTIVWMHPVSGERLAERGLFVWHGNFYAAQTFSNTPDLRRIQIGWGQGITFPGMPFNQQMALPVTLTLRRTAKGAEKRLISGEGSPVGKARCAVVSPVRRSMSWSVT